MTNLIDTPTGLGQRSEPCIRDKGVPVWIIQAYACRGLNITAIVALWLGWLTREEVEAAVDYEPQESHLDS